MPDDLKQAAETLSMRFSMARKQWKQTPPPSPSKAHYGGLVAGLEETLELVDARWTIDS